MIEISLGDGSSYQMAKVVVAPVRPLTHYKFLPFAPTCQLTPIEVLVEFFFLFVFDNIHYLHRTFVFITFFFYESGA